MMVRVKNLSSPFPALMGMLAALAAALFGGLLLSGIPPLETDIMDIVRASNAISWKTFLGWLFSPWSESVYEDGWFFHMIARPVQPFFFKILFTFFRDETLPYLLCRTAIAGALGALIYGLLYRFTASALFSLLGSLFVMTNPGTGASLVEFWDTEPLGQVFQAGALLCFLGLFAPWTSNGQPRQRTLKFALLLAGFYLAGSLAVKTKDTEKLMLPLLLWGFIFVTVFAGKWFGVARARVDRRTALVLAVCALILLPLIWVKKFGIAPMENHPWDMLKIIFWNPQGWEPERMISLFRLQRQLPCSVFASFGFALSWVLVLLSVPFLMRLMRPEFLRERRWFLLLLLWLGLSLPIFIVRPGLHLPRYLILPLIPIAMMFCLMVRTVLDAWPARWAKIAKAIVALLLLVQIADNARHALYFRNVLPAIWIKQYKMREEVYKHLTGRTSVRPLELHRAMRNLHYPIERMDLLYPVHRPDLFKNAQFLAMLDRYGAVYVGAVEPMQERPGLRLIRCIDALGDDPYSTLMKKCSSAGGEKLYLYLITSAP